MKKKPFWFLVLWMCFYRPLQSNGQDLNFHHYTVNDGLASSQVHDIIQDKYNRLWFTTDHGLSCYDGYSFKNYTTDDGLSDITLFKFYPDKKGRIWCTSFNKKVFYFSGYKPVFTPYKYNTAFEKLPDWCLTNSLRVEDDGSLSMGFIDAIGFVRVDKNGKTHNTTRRRSTTLPLQIFILASSKTPCFSFTEEVNNPEGVPKTWPRLHASGYVFNVTSNNHHKACYMEQKKCLVFATSKKVFIQFPNSTTKEISPGFEPISIGSLNDSLFWVGLRYGGVHIYNLKGQKKFAYLSGKSVTRLLVDHENGYWISTLNDGVFHAQNTTVYYYTHEENERNWVHSLAAMHDSVLYIGYYNGDVAVLRGGKLSTIHRSVQRMPANMSKTPDNRSLYFLTDYTLFNTRPGFKPYLMNLNPPRIFATKDDTVLLAGYSYYHKYCNQNKTHTHLGFRVTDICYYDGLHLIGTNQGLFQLTSTGAIPFHANAFSSLKITRLLAYKNGLILGTKYSGIAVWKNNALTFITKKSGLTENNINNLQIQNDSVIWASTNTGINRITFSKNGKHSVLSLTNRNGIVCNEVSVIEFMNDTAWVGTHQGLCSFPLNMLQKTDARDIDYKPVLTGIRVNDGETAIKNNLQLPYYKNRVEIEFKGVSFAAYQPLVYRYKLLGLETGWHYTTSRSALYSSLPYGRYKFVLQVKGKNRTWTKGQQVFSFIIIPPFWKTWWFFLVITASVLLLVYLFFRFQILSYNRDITRELLRQVLKRVRQKTMYVVFRQQGKDIRIPTHTICFVKSDGNYIEIHTDQKKYVIRHKIGEFLDLVPDPLEYLRISRSCIIRLDKVQEKSKKDVTVCGETLPVGETYLDQLQKIQF